MRRRALGLDRARLGVGEPDPRHSRHDGDRPPPVPPSPVRGMRKLTATGISRLATLLAGAALLVLGVEAAAGQTGAKTFVRTYDVRIVGSVTTTAPDVVLTEKATHTYRGVRIRVSESSGRVSVGLVETRRATDTGAPNGAMSGEVAYEESGSTPCSTSKEFSGPARLEILGSPGRSLSAAGLWRGKPGGAGLSRRDCPGLVNVAGLCCTWDYAKGRVAAQFNSHEAMYVWLLPLRRLPFPVNLVYAGKSFAASASGSMTDGFGVREGSLRITFTPRR